MGAGASAQTAPKYKWDHDHNLRGPWAFLFKEKVQCACEGGKWCSRENPAKQRQPNAIEGVHSSWVGDAILAMARPWQSIVEASSLPEAFRKAGIGMILNLQEVGEHATCGPGNLPRCGFTYDPDSFMAAGIGFYNFSWRDMGVPSLDKMMDIVQVMDYVTRVEGRKVAVHCHAGLGRTGLAIACFFVYVGRASPADAVRQVREHRPGALQTRAQVAFVTIFDQYCAHLRCLFRERSAAASTPGGSVHGGKGGKGGDGGSELPSEGLIESKEAGTTRVGVYQSGLTIVAPLKEAAMSTPEGQGLSDEDLGLTQHLPWSDTFHIVPERAKDFVALPPKSYTEALARQARVLHGPQRRACLRLHMLVKEVVFKAVSCAQAYSQVPSINAIGAVHGVAHITASGHAPSPLSKQSDKSSPPPPPAPGTFAEALALVIAHHSAIGINTEGLAPLLMQGGGATPLPQALPLLGPHVEASHLLPLLADLKHQLNRGDYSGMADAPLLLALMALEAFFGVFAAPALSVECLTAISNNYEALFTDMPFPPGTPHAASQAGSVASGGSQAQAAPGSAAPGSAVPGSAAPGSAVPGSAVPGSAASGTPPPRMDSQARCQQAYALLEPLPQPDFELLLVFAAMLRVAARTSGPGCEAAVADIGRWATHILLGKLAHMAEAEEAVLSFLWYLAGRDEAYAVLILIKRQRLAGRRPGKGMSSPVSSAELAAMLQAAAAPPAKAAGGSPPGVPPTVPEGEPVTPPPPAYTSPHPSGYFGLPPSAAHFQLPPNVALAELLAQDVQQLYRVSFREALAGITSVVYPPPYQSGNVDVHGAWR